MPAKKLQNPAVEVHDANTRKQWAFQEWARNGCTDDCNQGRYCTCVPKPVFAWNASDWLCIKIGRLKMGISRLMNNPLAARNDLARLGLKPCRPGTESPVHDGSHVTLGEILRSPVTEVHQDQRIVQASDR